MKANVYTILVAISLVALVTACVVLAMANMEMTGDLQQGGSTPHPFYIHNWSN